MTERNEVLEGWRTIEERLTELAGFPIGVDRAMRFARRRDDPLPVRKFGKGGGPVIADAVALAAWVSRQWSQVGTAERNPTLQGK